MLILEFFLFEFSDVNSHTHSLTVRCLQGCFKLLQYNDLLPWQKFVQCNRVEQNGLDQSLRCFTTVWFIIVCALEPNISSAKSDRAAGAAPGGKSSNHQPHKGLCDGTHRHRSCVSQRPPAFQKCQWFLGPTVWRPPHFPCCQTTGLPVCWRQPWSSRCSGEIQTFPLW